MGIGQGTGWLNHQRLDIDIILVCTYGWDFYTVIVRPRIDGCSMVTVDVPECGCLAISFSGVVPS